VLGTIGSPHVLHLILFIILLLFSSYILNKPVMFFQFCILVIPTVIYDTVVLNSNIIWLRCVVEVTTCKIFRFEL